MENISSLLNPVIMDLGDGKFMFNTSNRTVSIAEYHFGKIVNNSDYFFTHGEYNQAKQLIGGVLKMGSEELMKNFLGAGDDFHRYFPLGNTNYQIILGGRGVGKTSLLFSSLITSMLFTNDARWINANNATVYFHYTSSHRARSNFNLFKEYLFTTDVGTTSNLNVDESSSTFSLKNEKIRIVFTSDSNLLPNKFKSSCEKDMHIFDDYTNPDIIIQYVKSHSEYRDSLFVFIGTPKGSGSNSKNWYKELLIENPALRCDVVAIDLRDQMLNRFGCIKMLPPNNQCNENIGRNTPIEQLVLRQYEGWRFVNPETQKFFDLNKKYILHDI